MLPVQTICFVRAFFIAPLFSIYPLKRYKRYLIFSVYIFRLLRKGGEIMGTSSFEKAVCLQFNALMMILIKGTLSSHRRQIARRSRHEILFCELSEMKRVEHGINDEYFFDFTSFQVLNFTIRVSNEELGIALQELTEKQRTAILLHFFQGMNDREISELYHVSRSAINSRRDRGLKKLQKLLNERK